MKAAERRQVIADAGPFLTELDRRLANGGLDRGETADAEHQLRDIVAAVHGEELAEVAGLRKPNPERRNPAPERTKLVDHALELQSALAGGAEIVGLTQRPREDLTEVGNALRFVADHRDVARYVPGPGWHIWDGRRLKRDEDGGAMRLGKQTAASIADEAKLIDDEGRKKKLFSHHIASSKRNAIKAMLELAQSETPLIVDAEGLDADPFAFNVLNGTVDLRTGGLRPHDLVDGLTKLAPVEFDPDATAPRWRSFLEEIFVGDAELIAFVQRAAGYTLGGSTDEQCLFFCEGDGGNGKTTFAQTLRVLMGEYGDIAASGSLMAKRADAIPNDLASFRGARFLQCAETREGAQLDEILIKEATGGDPIKARFMRAEWFNYRPQFKIWMVGNHRPQVKGTDDAIWDRIRLVPFAARIRGTGQEEKGLDRKLRVELPGILNWAIDGCLAWQRKGLGQPPAVSEATESYRAEQDSLSGFLADCCAFGDGRNVTKRNLYAAYVDYCREHGTQARTDRALGKRVKALDGVVDGREGAARFWSGIGLTTGE